MKNTFYFSHDYNTRNDIKIKRLIAKHNYLGYGIFWAIIEDLYQNNNELELDYELLSYDLRADVEIVKSIINDFDLFVIKGKKFGSKSVEERLNLRDKKSKRASENARKRWGDNESRIKAENCIFYVIKIYDESESFIKCGITTESISRRYSGKLQGYKFQVLHQSECSVIDALDIENSIKEFALSYSPKTRFPGYLECYSIQSEMQILDFAMQSECKGNAIKESKGKERKVKEKKENFLLEKETKKENLSKENPTEIFPKTESVETGAEERKKVAPKKERFKPPTVQEVQDYCNERQNGIQAYTFVNFYQSKGWKVGNQPMKDWRAAVRTWEQKNKQNGITNTTNTGFSNNATVSNGKVSGRSIVADRISQHLARNSESGNHTIDIEANIVR